MSIYKNTLMYLGAQATLNAQQALSECPRSSGTSRPPPLYESVP